MQIAFVSALNINENNSDSNCYHLLSFCHVSDTILSNSHVLRVIINCSKEPGRVETVTSPNFMCRTLFGQALLTAKPTLLPSCV